MASGASSTRTTSPRSSTIMSSYLPEALLARRIDWIPFPHARVQLPVGRPRRWIKAARPIRRCAEVMTLPRLTESPLVRSAGLSYFPIAFVARLPFAMMVVGVLTLVVAERDSVALGGLNAAVAGIGTALAGPLLGAAADRVRQRRVLIPVGLLNALLLGAFVLVVGSRAPDLAVLGLSVLIGATAPQVAPLSRTPLAPITKRRVAPHARE